MEIKKWGYAVVMGFIVFLGLMYVNLLAKDSPASQQSFLGEVKSMVLGLIDRESYYWPSTSDHHHRQSVNGVLAPNLSSCHVSLTDADRPVYCCPPNPNEPFVDFQFPDPSTTPMRVRRAVQNLDEEFIEKYGKAILLMKALPFSDPRNFLRQANMHCLYCTGAYNQQNSTHLLKIHRSWLFFPWHRMLFYFHERIVGSLIGDPTFGLPFWNWDAPDGMVIPDMYMRPPFSDCERDAGHLPPKIADDNYDYVESGLGAGDQIESNLALMYHQMISGAKKPELFLGCKYKAGENGSCDGPGTIELAPHNPLHTWVGNNLQPEREDLGAFYTAGRDPIFYAHHSNVDRMWELWQQFRDYEPEVTDPDWLDSYFFFHDEKLQLVRIKIRDVLNITKLRYSYEQVELPWLNARPRPSVEPKISRNLLKIREINELNELRLPHFGSKGRKLETAIRVKVNRPNTKRSEKEKEEEEEVLVVYGIEVKKDRYVKFDVFVNAVNETGLGPQCREFAGTFVNVRMGVRLVMKKGDRVEKRKKTSLKMGISELLEDLEADGDESIWVSLVPRGGTGVHASVEGVQIEYMR